jgi:hypothetical protein
MRTVQTTEARAAHEAEAIAGAEVIMKEEDARKGETRCSVRVVRALQTV